jgi:DNA replication protein DnaC
MILIDKVPKRYEGAVVPRENGGEWNADIHEVVVDFLANFGEHHREGRGPLLVGSGGTGKSYAAAAVALHLAQKVPEATGQEYSFVWAPVGETMRTMANYRDLRRADLFFTLDAKLKKADLVVFDDFGFVGEFARFNEDFYVYVNSRYENMLQTMFTGQFDLRKDGWNGLRARCGEALVRRLQEMCEGLVVLV